MRIMADMTGDAESIDMALEGGIARGDGEFQVNLVATARHGDDEVLVVHYVATFAGSSVDGASEDQLVRFAEAYATPILLPRIHATINDLGYRMGVDFGRPPYPFDLEDFRLNA